MLHGNVAGVYNILSCVKNFTGVNFFNQINSLTCVNVLINALIRQLYQQYYHRHWLPTNEWSKCGYWYVDKMKELKDLERINY